jgi:hypothetical protein
MQSEVKAMNLEGISAETARRLMVQAAMNGLSVEEYLKRLPGLDDSRQPESSPDDFMADLEALAEGTAHLVPTGLSYSLTFRATENRYLKIRSQARSRFPAAIPSI